MRGPIRVALLVSLAWCGPGGVGPALADFAVGGGSAFERLKSELVGEWTGTLRPIDQPVAATFFLSGNGSALVEDIRRLDKDSRMLTVYYLDGEDLRSTHFCSFRNQPRLRATAISERNGGLEIEFTFVDVTNLNESGPRYTHRIVVALRDRNHASVTYFGLVDGVESGYLTAELERVRPGNR